MNSILSQLSNALNQGSSILLEAHEFADIKKLIDIAIDAPEKPKDFKIQYKKVEQKSKIFLVSGGLDSAIMWKMFGQDEESAALFYNFKQPYLSKEKNAINSIGIPHIEKELFYDVPHWEHIIPARNLAFMLDALTHLEERGEIWIGAVAGESSPESGDKSKAFFSQFELVSKNYLGKDVTVKTMESRTKNKWLSTYLDQTGDLSVLNSISCYSANEGHCGECQACLRRWICLTYCKLDSSHQFNVDPLKGATKYVKKYLAALNHALSNKDFAHYSRDRCIEDLSVLEQYG